MAVLAAIGGMLGLFAAIELLGHDGTAIFWALVTLILASISLVFAFGAWYLKAWAWLFGLGVEGLTILVALINWIGISGGSLVFLASAAISGAILYYLFTPEIKRVFGRG